VGPKDIGNVYLLRLTYKIRPIERQLPSAGELKTRAEMDVVQVFVEAFANRPVHPDDLALARRVLTHDGAEQIVAGLLRDHLGARGGDAAADAAEARRARNPQAQSAPPPRDLKAESGAGPSHPTPPELTPTPREPRRDRERRKPAVERPIAYTGWEPPKEADDEQPILASAESEPQLPRVTVSSGRTANVSAPAARDRGADELLGPDFLELFVNVGKRDGVRASDLQRLLSEKGLSSVEVGQIRIRDRMSYLNVRKDAFERAVAALAGQLLGGRTLVAELARGRA
jgi:ATP-dependent RNA helicase DeaD